MYFIVVAEDDPSDIFLLKEATKLHKIPCQIVSVENGPQLSDFIEDACREAKRERPDLLILDWTLPRANMSDLLKIIRKSIWCMESPILVFTALTSPESINAAFEGGATCFIQKPIDLDEFMEIGVIIRELLEGGSHLDQVKKYFPTE